MPYITIYQATQLLEDSYTYICHCFDHVLNQTKNMHIVPQFLQHTRYTKVYLIDVVPLSDSWYLFVIARPQSCLIELGIGPDCAVPHMQQKICLCQCSMRALQFGTCLDSAACLCEVCLSPYLFVYGVDQWCTNILFTGFCVYNLFYCCTESIFGALLFQRCGNREGIVEALSGF